MVKKFAPRIRKKERKTIDLSDRLDRDLFKLSDERLLKGARLEEVKLSTITVKEQVRTKFNDRSLKDLSENIRLNGLIQPLVVHRQGKVLTLICGERRFRAMSLIKKESAPCFILENKSEDELMAIQFSENSAREELHYVDKADGIWNYQKATKASERQIVKALGISKSEVHRSLIIAKLSREVKEAAKAYNTEKYVLVEFHSLEEGELKGNVCKMICNGEIKKRSHLKKAVGPSGRTLKAKKGTQLKKETSSKKEAPSKTLVKVISDEKNVFDEKTQKLAEKIISDGKKAMEEENKEKKAN